jgi:hypothetical protein
MTISRSRAGLLLAGLALAACSGTGTGRLDAEALGKRFCAAVMAGDEAAAVALMTPELQAKIAQVKVFDAGWRQRNPTEKPPLGDGLRLTAWQDAPQSCTPEVAADGSVLLTYVPAGVPTERWQDRLVLTTGRPPRIADIGYDRDNSGGFDVWLDAALASPG